MFRLLMRTRILAARNVVQHAWRRQPLTALALSLGSVGLFGIMFAGFLLFFRFAASVHVLPETISQAFYYLFLLLLAGAVPFVASTLLQSEDYNLLFAAPIAPRTVIAAKLLDATVTNSLQFSVLGFPAIVACAVAVKLPIAAWLIVPPLIALFVLLPALLTAMALLIVLAALGMRRLRSGITLINVLMGVIVCITFVLETKNLPIRLVSAGGRWTMAQPALSSTSQAAHLAPSFWFASALLDLGQGGELRQAAVYLLLILLSCGLLFAASMALGDRLLSLSSLAESETGSAIRPAGGYRKRSGPAIFSAPVAGMITKDLKFVLRDNMLISQMCVPLILFAVPFLLAFQNRTLDPRSELYPFSVGIVGFIVYMQTSILSLSLLGMEGQSFWVTLISPNARRTVLLAKWIASTLVSASVGILLGLFAGLAFHADGGVLLIQMVVTAASASALCAIGVGISALFPRFVHENPAMRVSPWALIVGFFASTGYVILAGLIFGFTFYLLSNTSGGHQTAAILTVSGALYLLLTLLTTALSLVAGLQRIERYEWEH